MLRLGAALRLAARLGLLAARLGCRPREGGNVVLGDLGDGNARFGGNWTLGPARPALFAVTLPMRGTRLRTLSFGMRRAGRLCAGAAPAAAAIACLEVERGRRDAIDLADRNVPADQLLDR